METLRRDLAFAVRQLRKSPSFALIAIVSLALGIGATTAAAGLTLSVVLARVFAAWTRETSADPLILTAAVLLFAGAAAAACLIPARRASSIDPMAALRCD